MHVYGASIVRCIYLNITICHLVIALLTAGTANTNDLYITAVQVHFNQ